MFFLFVLFLCSLCNGVCAASAQQDGHELGKLSGGHKESDVFFVHTSHEHDINMLARCSIESASTRIQGNVVVYSNAWTIEDYRGDRDGGSSENIIFKSMMRQKYFAT